MKKEIKKPQIKFKRGPVEIYAIQKYGDSRILVQKIGYNIWQWVVYRRGKFYQGWNRLRPKWYRWFLLEPYSRLQKLTIVNFCIKSAQSTIDTLEKDEKYKREKKK